MGKCPCGWTAIQVGTLLFSPTPPLIAAGHDDAFAILLAAYHPALHLLGISTVHGNAPLSKTTGNALSILQAIGKPDVPVHPGASKPFCREVHHAPEIHGESGIDGTDLLPIPVRSPLIHCNAIKDMRDALLSCPPDTVWLVTCGTLTNAALLFATFPEVISHIKGLSIMGGAVGNSFTSALLGPDFQDEMGQNQSRIGNYSPYAEFNIWCDPEAAQSILGVPQLAKKTALITLDLTHQAFVNEKIRNRLLNARDNEGTPTKLRQMFHELLMYFAHTYATVFGLTEGPPLHDPLAVAVLLSLITDDDMRIDFHDDGKDRWEAKVILSGDQLGRTVVKPASSGEGVTIPRSLDFEKFWDSLDNCLAAADTATGHVR